MLLKIVKFELKHLDSLPNRDLSVPEFPHWV